MPYLLPLFVKPWLQAIHFERPIEFQTISGNKVTYISIKDIPVILDYCAEGSLDHKMGEGFLDQNAALFAESA